MGCCIVVVELSAAVAFAAPDSLLMVFQCQAPQAALVSGELRVAAAAAFSSLS